MSIGRVKMVFLNQDFKESLKTNAQEVFEDLVKKYNASLLNFARSRGCSEYAAADLTQETWCEFFSNPQRFRGESAIKSYLIGILHNKIRNYKRKEKRYSYTFSGEFANYECIEKNALINSGKQSSQEVRLAAKRALHKVANVMGDMPILQSKVFQLDVIEGADRLKVCSEMNISRKYLDVLIHRARKTIAKEMVS